MRIIDSIYKINKNDELREEFNINKIRCSYGEAISFQIAIRLDSEIKDIDLKIDSKNYYDIYFEYFHHIERTSTIFVKPGEYPDCLVPYELFIKNKLYKNLSNGDNLIFNINLRIKSKASEALGVTLRINDRIYNSLLDIELLDINLGEEIKCKTLFGIFSEMYEENSDYSLDTYIDYYNRLLNKYKISSNKIVARYDSLLPLVDRIVALASNNDVSTIPLPIIRKEDNTYDVEYIYDVLKRLISLSNLNDTNYLKKLVIYNYYLDEPEPDRFLEVGQFKRDIDIIKARLSPICDQLALKDTLINIPNITTVFYRKDLYDRVDTWCPTYVALQEPELLYEYNSRRRYGDKSWWYGCVWPMHPYPNFHIDDDLINIRALAYMQFYYKIEGSLYWAVNIDKKYNLEKKEYEDCNLLKTPMVFPPANGDGYLTYPGKLFNTRLPLPSLRLDAIKNSIYDYQYLMVLDNNLLSLSKKYNLDYDRFNYFKPIFKYMFHGVIAYRRYDIFSEINNFIKNLILLSNKGTYLELKEDAPSVLYTKNKIDILNEEKKDGYYKYILADNLEYIIDNILINNKRAKGLAILNDLSLSLNDKERYVVDLDNKININSYFNLLLNIDASSIHPFSLIAYGINEDGLEWPLGYSIVKDSGLYDIAIDLKNTSYYADIDSTALCSRYNLFKNELEKFLSGRLKAIAFEANDYRTFNDEVGRYKDTYSFTIKKATLEEIR